MSENTLLPNRAGQQRRKELRLEKEISRLTSALEVAERTLGNVHTRLSMLGQSCETRQEAMGIVFEDLEEALAKIRESKDGC